jgi:hypothetical protein
MIGTSVQMYSVLVMKYIAKVEKLLLFSWDFTPIVITLKILVIYSM